MIKVLFFLLFSLPVWAEDVPALFETKPERDPSGRMGRLIDALDRHRSQQPGEWAGMVAEVKGLVPLEQVKQVHRLINARIAYAEDQGNEWKSPAESFARGGDCEDYAIAKMALLMDAGFPEEAMRVVTLAPAHAESPHHVVLVADTGRGHWLLDSPERKQSAQAIPLNEYREKVRAVVWSGWRGGFSMSGQDMEGNAATRVVSSGGRRGGSKKLKSGAPSVWGAFDLPLFPGATTAASGSSALPYASPMQTTYTFPSSQPRPSGSAASAPLVVRDAAMGGPKPMPSFMTGIPPY